MARKKRYLTATMADGYVKTIGPTAAPFAHPCRFAAAAVSASLLRASFAEPA